MHIALIFSQAADAWRRYKACRPWKEALIWLCLLGPFFFITYGGANAFTATRTDVNTCVFAWERYIPFVPWTIIPYWSIDLFYGFSLFICTTRKELRMHVTRLVLSTIVCVMGFLLFPLRMTFLQPETSGLFGWMFTSLAAFDMPYNQAPSLHICLLVVLWDIYRRHMPQRLLPVVHCWALLIGVSVLTTYQHHSIDIITGFAAGILCCYAVPNNGWQRWRPAEPEKSRRLAVWYTVGSLLFLGIAMVINGWGWGLVWPALALGCVAAGYWGLGPQVMQKSSESGKLSFASVWLLAPYRTVAALTRRHYLSKAPAAAEVIDGLWLGSFPKVLPDSECGVLDLCAEYPRAPATAACSRYHALPMLDLLSPTPGELSAALEVITAMHTRGPIFVHCALGLTRSAAVVAVYLAKKNGMSFTEALATVEAARPGVVLSQNSRDFLAAHTAALSQLLCHEQDGRI